MHQATHLHPSQLLTVTHPPISCLQGYVSLAKLVQFNKLRQMTTGDVDELVAAAVLSPVLKVKAQAIRLRKGWHKWIPPPLEGEDRGDDDESSEDESSEAYAEGHPLPSADDVNGSAEEHKTAAELQPGPGMLGGQGGYYHPGLPPQPVYYNFPPAAAYGYQYYPHPYYAAQLNPVLMQQQHFAQQQQQQQQHQHQAQQQHHSMYEPHQQGPGGGPGMDVPGRRGQPRHPYHNTNNRGGRGGRGGHQAGPKRGGQGGGQFSGAASPMSGRPEGGGGGPAGPSTPPHEN